MIASVHQPNYIPWMGYFYKIFKSDIFIMLDDVQYIKRGFINRNKIKTHQGERWLTVPVRCQDSSRCKINEVLVGDELHWRDNHLKNIEANYKRAEYYDILYPTLRDCLMCGFEKLSDLNIHIIKALCKVLDIRTEIVLSSELGIEESGTMRIIEICRAVGAERYLSGSGGAQYQDEQKFRDYSIELEYLEFSQKPYRQLWGEFTGNMSVIDYIFNCGYDIRKFWGE